MNPQHAESVALRALRIMAAIVQSQCNDADFVTVDGQTFTIGSALDTANALLEPAVVAESAEQRAVAWMDPETRDVIHTERKHDWQTQFGAGGRVQAASYTVPLYSNALAAPHAGAVPDGWKLVPVEPTAEMLGAGLRHVQGMASMPSAWHAMLSAAPAAPAPCAGNKLPEVGNAD